MSARSRSWSLQVCRGCIGFGVRGLSGSFPLHPGFAPLGLGPKAMEKALNKGIWVPKARVTNIKGFIRLGGLGGWGWGV